jgi:hypothetical protein
MHRDAFSWPNRQRARGLPELGTSSTFEDMRLTHPFGAGSSCYVQGVCSSRFPGGSTLMRPCNKYSNSKQAALVGSVSPCK